MDIQLKPGTYVIAVSGGVDSMALLHRLQSLNDGQWKLVIAHLDHGIREDSQEDRKLVENEARNHGLPFVYHEARLGPGASEAAARKARYDFLHQVARAAGARAIITAHHQDDLLETAILNIIRGTGRKGLTSLASRHDVERPLLGVTKPELRDYAAQHGLRWREDSTNQDTRYRRNYVRHNLLPRLSPEDRDKLISHIKQLHKLNYEIDQLLASCLHTQTHAGELDRDWFAHLPHTVAREVMAAWLRARGIMDFDKKMLERLVVAAKTADHGSRHDLLSGHKLRVNHNNLALVGHER
jgi:tRNA(Ile)-lysidine synthase